jgi:hypothetical protein
MTASGAGRPGGRMIAMIDAGLLVVSPSRHASVLAAAYSSDDLGDDDAAARRAISRAVLAQGCFLRLNSRLHTNFLHRAVVQHWHVYTGLHAGNPGLLRLALAVELANSFFTNLGDQWELAALVTDSHEDSAG